VQFNLLHAEDGGRVGNKRVCKKCGEEIEADEVVKGYEYEKGEYVTVSDEDLKKSSARGFAGNRHPGFCRSR